MDAPVKTADNSEKAKALQAALAQIEKQFGKGTIMRLGEGEAVHALFGQDLPCSSTKGATGHALGAAGAVEALICALALTDNFLPGSPGTENLDPDIRLDYLLNSREGTVRRALTNSFGFGGSNCSLIFGVAP